MTNQQADETDDAAIDASTANSETLVTTHASSTFKVLGEIDAPNGAGILGHNTATSGTAIGVEGVTDSSDNFSAGLRGTATGNNGILYGTTGTNSSSTDLSAGVHGRYRGSGQGWGTEGITDSEATGSAGVRGGASQSSGVVYGVRGETNSGDGFGLYTPDDAKIDESLQFTSGAPDMFIFESGTTNPDQNVISHSPDFPGWGLRYDDDGDNFVFQSGGTADMTVRLFDPQKLDVHGDAQVEGHVDIDQVGVSAYLSTSQSISSNSTTIVAFDTTKRDDFGGFDTSTGRYTVQQAGDYHVSTVLEWFNRLSGGTLHQPHIHVNGNSRAERLREVAGSSSNSSYVHEHLSKTLYGLSAGDVIDVRVYQDSGSSQEISSGSNHSYVTIDKVGGSPSTTVASTSSTDSSGSEKS